MATIKIIKNGIEHVVDSNSTKVNIDGKEFGISISENKIELSNICSSDFEAMIADIVAGAKIVGADVEENTSKLEAPFIVHGNIFGSDAYYIKENSCLDCIADSDLKDIDLSFKYNKNEPKYIDKVFEYFEHIVSYLQKYEERLGHNNFGFTFLPVLTGCVTIFAGISKTKENGLVDVYIKYDTSCADISLDHPEFEREYLLLTFSFISKIIEQRNVNIDDCFILSESIYSFTDFISPELITKVQGRLHVQSLDFKDAIGVCFLAKDAKKLSIEKLNYDRKNEHIEVDFDSKELLYNINKERTEALCAFELFQESFIDNFTEITIEYDDITKTLYEKNGFYIEEKVKLRDIEFDKICTNVTNLSEILKLKAKETKLSSDDNCGYEGVLYENFEATICGTSKFLDLDYYIKYEDGEIAIKGYASISDAEIVELEKRGVKKFVNNDFEYIKGVRLSIYTHYVDTGIAEVADYKEYESTYNFAYPAIVKESVETVILGNNVSVRNINDDLAMIDAGYVPHIVNYVDSDGNKIDMDGYFKNYILGFKPSKQNVELLEKNISNLLKFFDYYAEHKRIAENYLNYVAIYTRLANTTNRHYSRCLNSMFDFYSGSSKNNAFEIAKYEKEKYYLVHVDNYGTTISSDGGKIEFPYPYKNDKYYQGETCDAIPLYVGFYDELKEEIVTESVNGNKRTYALFFAIHIYFENGKLKYESLNKEKVETCDGVVELFKEEEEQSVVVYNITKNDDGSITITWDNQSEIDAKWLQINNQRFYIGEEDA